MCCFGARSNCPYSVPVSVRQGTTDLEKHLAILVLENDRLKQELNSSQLRFQQLRASVPTCTDCEHSKVRADLDHYSRACHFTQHLPAMEHEASGVTGNLAASLHTQRTQNHTDINLKNVSFNMLVQGEFLARTLGEKTLDPLINCMRWLSPS